MLSSSLSDDAVAESGSESSTSKSLPKKEPPMLHWALMFLVIAMIAAVLGFTGIAVAAAGIAKLLFFLFLILFVITLFAHMGRRSSTEV
jgi:uncharacterized membrane protein YtjA (UPF0391 family)